RLSFRKRRRNGRPQPQESAATARRLPTTQAAIQSQKLLRGERAHPAVAAVVRAIPGTSRNRPLGFGISSSRAKRAACNGVRNTPTSIEPVGPAMAAVLLLPG